MGRSEGSFQIDIVAGRLVRTLKSGSVESPDRHKADGLYNSDT